MTILCWDVLKRLKGKPLVTAESITGGGIGAALTAIPGASEVYRGGVISYCDDVKHEVLGVSREILNAFGAVSSQTAMAMARGAGALLKADVAVSVTGLAGPGGDEFGHPVGAVFIGYADAERTAVRECHFTGGREEIRSQTSRTALELVLEMTNAYKYR